MSILVHPVVTSLHNERDDRTAAIFACHNIKKLTLRWLKNSKALENNRQYNGGEV